MLTVGVRWLVGLLLLGSLALNVTGGLWAYQDYLELNQTPLDPVGLGAYVSDANHVGPKQGELFRVLFDGDS